MTTSKEESSPHRSVFLTLLALRWVLTHENDYQSNITSYATWQAWMQRTQPHLLVLWGKYELSFDSSEPEAFRRDVPNAEVHIIDGVISHWIQPQMRLLTWLTAF